MLYEEDISAASAPPILLDQPDDYTIQSSDLGNWISLPFSSAINLMSGTQYRIAIGANISFTDTVGLNVSGNGEYSVDGMYDKDAWYDGSNGAATWYTIGDIPMLRMNFDPASGLSSVKNISESIFNIYPNPNNGVFNITTEKLVDYNISITNILGQEVLTTQFSDLNTTIDLSNFDKGIYTIEMISEGQVFSEKIVVE